MAYTNSKLHIVAVGGKQVNADWNETDPTSPAYIQNKPRIAPGLHYEIVESLPTEDIDPTAIYMILRENPETGNYYDEYMYIDGDWEMIGSTATQNIQADWAESDPSNPAYINNKPTNLVFGNLGGSPAPFTVRSISAPDYANLPSYDSNTIYLVY